MVDFFANLFNGASAITTAVLALALTIYIGGLVGKLHIGKVKLGIAGVLFTGIVIAHFGVKVESNMLYFAQELGLILFVYAVGIDVGPRFFSAFRSEGLRLNIYAIVIIFLGFGVAYGFYYWGGVKPEVMTGIMCGAVTNTPGLGAANSAIVGAYSPEHAEEAKSVIGNAYAMAYPLGVIGIILTMLIVRAIFRVKIDGEVKEYSDSIDTSSHLESVVINITNQNLYGKTIGYIKNVIDQDLVISRIERNGEFIIPTEMLEIQKGDIAHGVSRSESIENLKIQLGDVEIGQKREVEGALVMKNTLVTNEKVDGKTIEQIGIYRRYEANITRIYRAGMEILPTKSTVIQIGDTVRIVGKKDLMDDVEKELGNSIKELSHPNILPMFLGIALGVILGSIPIPIGLSAPAKLGLAGGPLIVAILMGWKGRIRNFSFYMNPGANMMIRELGITLFLGSVGLKCGGSFVDTFLGEGKYWVLYGAAITLIPLIIVSFFARAKGMNYLKICGFMAGSMTDPPALEYANSLASTHAQSMAYASVYPMTMFLRILLGQALILITL